MSRALKDILKMAVIYLDMLWCLVLNFSLRLEIQGYHSLYMFDDSFEFLFRHLPLCIMGLRSTFNDADYVTVSSV